MSNNGKFAVVHNGIIENYIELREELTAKGYVFSSETDTEVIVHLLDMYYSGDCKKAVMKAAARLQGSYALGVICADFPGSVFAVKQESPLIIGVGAGENYFASDVTALADHTKNLIYLEDGEFAELTPVKAAVFDCTGAEIAKPITRIVWDVGASQKSGYDHFMLKEIYEQPRALKAAIEPRVKNNRITFDGFDMTNEEARKISKIIVTACGSAYYAGCVGRYAIEELCGVPVEMDYASELRYRSPIVDENTLLIVISQSGETADSIAAVKELKRRGVRVLAIVNVVASTIANLADNVIYTWAGPEIAVATTKGYTTQVAALTMFALWFSEKLGRISESRYDALVKELLLLPGLAQRAIDLNPHIQDLALRYHNNSSIFFIGRNIDCAVCLEGSLKLKEISYIHSEAYAAGELKHGTIALIEPGRLVVALCCHTALFDKMMSNIREVKARGAEVLGVALEGDRRILMEADDVIYVPKADPLLGAIPRIIPLQLFAYYVAKCNGCDIDKPKNLAKSVTVE
jgi:glucosamine--fructose-6-phosphate aminotransferase (isomerizing)